MERGKLQLTSAFRLTLFLLFFACAHSQVLADTPPDLLDGVLKGYKDASGSWFDKIFPIAKDLFWKLAAIELAWAAIVWTLQQDQMQPFVAAVVKKIIGIGFFYAILLEADQWMPAIINSFTKAGQTATGLTELTPSRIFDRGIDLGNLIVSEVSVLGTIKNPFTSVMAGWSSIFIVIAFIVIAGQLLVTLVESYIVITAGILFLGFGGSRWTSDLAQKYISYALATGVKLFMIYLITGVALEQSATWSELLKGLTFKNVLIVLGASVLMAILAFQIPSMAAGMLSGATSLTAGSAMAAGAAVAAGTVSAGSRVISPTLQGARGGTQALKAGYDHHRATGSGRVASALKAIGTSTVDYGREAGRSLGEAVGLAKPTTSEATTIGGRAAEGRRSATDAMREQQAAVSSQGLGSTLNTSASNTSASTSPASNNSSPGSGTQNQTPNYAGNFSQYANTGQASFGGQDASNSTRQASDRLVDNAPSKLGSAQPQTTATNKADINQSIAGLTSASPPAATMAAQEGAQHQAATATALQNTQEPPKFGPMKTTDASDATWNSDPNEKRATSTAARGKTRVYGRDRKIFSDLDQVRPPNIPNDSAPQTGVNIRANYSDD